MVHNHQEREKSRPFYLQPSKTVLLALCINVEMLIIRCCQAITCKIYLRLFEAATLLPMSGHAIESPLHASSPVQDPVDLVRSYLAPNVVLISCSFIGISLKRYRG